MLQCAGHAAWRSSPWTSSAWTQGCACSSGGAQHWSRTVNSKNVVEMGQNDVLGGRWTVLSQMRVMVEHVPSRNQEAPREEDANFRKFRAYVFLFMHANLF